MSLRIIKSGVFDTIQDQGRNGFQFLGINPGGPMERFSAQAVNMLVGNEIEEPIIELHFPPSIFLFEAETLLAVGGADFGATINGDDIPLWQPLIVAKNSILQFQKWKQGARCYLGIREKLKVEKWLNSYSTNVKAGAGGIAGRALQKDDVILYKEGNGYSHLLNDNDFAVLPWKADVAWSDALVDWIIVIPGNEWDWLTEHSRDKFLKTSFVIDSLADRMGYRLRGTLEANKNGELVSSAVTFGTVQLLPNGELIVLMADHQTTGGYLRIAHVVSVDLPALAQKRPGDFVSFRITDQEHAEDLLMRQQQHLSQLQIACKFRLQEFFNSADANSRHQL